ncbi:MAG: beta-lactamase family protein, partial [Spirochaetes bacterium]|nr:beta-lactamase family protein [Spirochaetota bacterium]
MIIFIIIKIFPFMLNGYVHPSFKEAASTFETQIPSGKPGGAALAVYYKGECVIDAWGGTRDEYGNPWEKDTLSLSFSTSKGVMSTLMHILADKKMLDYDDPVVKFWPEFGQSGKEKITIRQIMCHEAGLYNIRDMIDHAGRMFDWEYMINTLAAAKPLHEPGKSHGYHGLTYGWLTGEIIQRVTGKKLSAVLHEELSKPLGLDGLYIGLPEAERHRRARLVSELLKKGQSMPDFPTGKSRLILKALHRYLQIITLNKVNIKTTASALSPKGMVKVDLNSDKMADAAIPAMNGFFTARSLAKMYAMLANGGELNGVRLLSKETLSRARVIQNKGLDRVVPFPMRWRLGYHEPFIIGRRIKDGFGHFGFGGSGGWADPRRNIALGMVLNSGIGSPFGDIRIVKLNGAVI